MNRQDLPNFMLIGAAKAGTTSLHHYLLQHPEIYLPKEKELQFFTDDSLYQHGIDYYSKTYFKDAHRFTARGEATPFYFHRPKIVIPRLKKAFSDDELKFILILRHPVLRAWSHYQHMVRLGVEKESFRDALALEGSRLSEAPLSWFSYYSDGLYGSQLKAWLDTYSRDKFLILTQDELNSAPETTLEKIFLFLEIDPTFRVEDLSVKNEARAPINKSLMKLLMGEFPGASLIKKAISVPTRRRLGMMLRHAATKPAEQKQPMEQALFLELKDKYKQDMDELEKLLGYRIQSWH